MNAKIENSLGNGHWLKRHAIQLCITLCSMTIAVFSVYKAMDSAVAKNDWRLDAHSVQIIHNTGKISDNETKIHSLDITLAVVVAQNEEIKRRLTEILDELRSNRNGRPQ